MIPGTDTENVVPVKIKKIHKRKKNRPPASFLQTKPTSLKCMGRAGPARPIIPNQIVGTGLDLSRIISINGSDYPKTKSPQTHQTGPSIVSTNQTHRLKLYGPGWTGPPGNPKPKCRDRAWPVLVECRQWALTIPNNGHHCPELSPNDFTTNPSNRPQNRFYKPTQQAWNVWAGLNRPSLLSRTKT